MIANRILEVVLGNAVAFTINVALLAFGAVIEHFFPFAMFWFLGISSAAGLVIVLFFALVLIANLADMPPDNGNYPGS